MSDIELTAGQREALAHLESMRSWNGVPRIGVVRGVAGSGKTYVLQHMARELGGVIVLAPTGKAAQRVKELCSLEAMTIHRWSYKPIVDKNTGQVSFRAKPLDEIEKPTSHVVFVDEASMVGSELWQSLHGICMALELNIIIIGDHAQLPPVSREREAFSLVAADFPAHWSVTLTEIHRQALGSPIIRASMEIRSGDVLDGLLQLPRVPESGLVAAGLETLAAGGVVLCHTNGMRHRLNRELRTARYGGTEELQPGEPLLVLKNSYAANRFNGEVLTFNGWTDKLNAELPVYCPYSRVRKSTGFGLLDAGTSAPIYASVATGVIRGDMEEFSAGTLEKAAKRLYLKEPYLHVNYGYALSVHKSQGSSWPQVLVVIEPSVKLNTPEGRSWAYTATTRAENHIRVCFT